MKLPKLDTIISRNCVMAKLGIRRNRREYIANGQWDLFAASFPCEWIFIPVVVLYFSAKEFYENRHRVY